MKKIIIILLPAILFSLILASQLNAKQRGIKVIAKTPAGKTIPLYSGSYALVVGNGDYTNRLGPSAWGNTRCQRRCKGTEG